VTLILFGHKFCKRFLDFAFTSFHGKFDRQSVAGTDPDFIGGVCDDSGFNPSSAFQAIGFKDMERRWSKLFRAVRNLYLARVPVYGRVDFLQPWESEYNIFRTKICNEKIGRLVSRADRECQVGKVSE
jgi:hypothetical protein